MQKWSNTTLNILKCIACFAVVTLHCSFPGIIGKVIYGNARFAVPLFFMVSGYFIYSDDSKEVLHKLPRKIIHIFSIYLFMEALYFIWYCIKSMIEYPGVKGIIIWISETFKTGNIINYIFFQTTFIASAAWFLVALILCYAITYPIAKYGIWEKTFVFIPILLCINLFLGEVAPFLGIESQWYWCSNFWFLGFPFYALGYFTRCHENEIERVLSLRKLLFMMILSILLNLIERIGTHASQLFASNVIFAFCAFVFCLKRPEYFKENCIVRITSNIGAYYSLGVYVLHPLIRDIYRMYADRIGIATSVAWLWILPILTFSTSVIIYKVFLGGKEKWNRS